MSKKKLQKNLWKNKFNILKEVIKKLNISLNNVNLQKNELKNYFGILQFKITF